MGGSAVGKRSTPRSRNEKTPSTTRNSISIVVNTGRRTQTSANVIVFFSYPQLRCLEFVTNLLSMTYSNWPGCRNREAGAAERTRISNTRYRDDHSDSTVFNEESECPNPIE